MTNRRGQITAETAVLICCAIAGLLAMKGYVQRAIQSNLFSGSQAVGLQYDSRNGHHEQAAIHINERVEQHAQWGMFGGDILEQPEDCTTPVISPSACPHYGGATYGGGILTEVDDRYYQRFGRILSSLPSGPVPREPAFQDTKADMTWTATSDARYDDVR